MSEHDADEAAVRRSGAPGPLVREFDHFSRPLKALLVCGAVATAGIALWLFPGVPPVPPPRDPAPVPMWTAVAPRVPAYPGVTPTFFVRRPPSAAPPPRGH